MVIFSLWPKSPLLHALVLGSQPRGWRRLGSYQNGWLTIKMLGLSIKNAGFTKEKLETTMQKEQRMSTSKTFFFRLDEISFGRCRGGDGLPSLVKTIGSLSLIHQPKAGSTHPLSQRRAEWAELECLVHQASLSGRPKIAILIAMKLYRYPTLQIGTPNVGFL